MPRTRCQLARRISNPDEKEDEGEQQRKNIWGQAQCHRKKELSLPCGLRRLERVSGHCWTRQPVSALRRASSTSVTACGSISADLVTESKGSWQRPPVLQKETVQAMTQCLQKFPMKEYDIVICFDGCVTENKTLFRSVIGDEQKLLEFVLLYQCRPREGRQRKIFCGSLKVETAVMRLFVPRVRFSVKERTDDFLPPVAQGDGSSVKRHKKAAGKPTTHDLTSVGVPPATKRPLMSCVDKRKAFPDADEPVSFRGSACPLFWAETKPVSYWSMLLDTLDVGQVMDLTPGSGCLAEAALAADIPYLGVVKNQCHYSWLMNSLDKHCLKMLADSVLSCISFANHVSCACAFHFTAWSF